MADLIERSAALWITAETGALETQSRITELPAVNRWIPCSDRLPEQEGRYLCSLYYAIPPYHLLHPENDAYIREVSIQHFDGKSFKASVVAWMPMPDAYKLPESEVQSGAEDELKPCPFCGGKAELRQEDFDPRWMPTRNDPDSGGCPPYYVKCNDCGANTEYRYAYPDAVKLWNRRDDNG